jgi:hypothetical protein
MVLTDREKAILIKAVCAVAPDTVTLEIAKWWEMAPNGDAAAHLDHYLEGSGSLVTVDLSKLVRVDAGVRRRLQVEIITKLRDGITSGIVPIPQTVYQDKDQKYALGSININWRFPSTEGEDKVHIGFRNQYRWHPDESRITQCIHKAAQELQASQGAKEYSMEGRAEITLSLSEWSRKTPRFHVVRPGETLSRLALRYYGRANRWPEIHGANRARLPNPNRLAIGLLLEIP